MKAHKYTFYGKIVNSIKLIIKYGLLLGIVLFLDKLVSVLGMWVSAVVLMLTIWLLFKLFFALYGFLFGALTVTENGIDLLLPFKKSRNISWESVKCITVYKKLPKMLEIKTLSNNKLFLIDKHLEDCDSLFDNILIFAKDKKIHFTEDCQA